MKNLKNHIIISMIAWVSTNLFFVLAFIFAVAADQQNVTLGVSIWDMVLVSNLALVLITILSISYKSWGDKMLEWGYSNVTRGMVLIILSIVAFAIFSSVILALLLLARFESEWLQMLSEFTISPHFVALLLYFSAVSTMMFFISNLERRSGNVFRLIAQSLGDTLQPHLVNRGFMFIDLNDATTIAERLTSRQYAHLLRDCFSMLNELVYLTPFEIYQYVGDQAVITWKTETPMADVKALQLFSDFKTHLNENHTAFAKAYHLQPQFKCAIHSGPVVKSEIGGDVKHLVYHGDVLNTTARLLSQCHQENTDLILSQEAFENKHDIQVNYHCKAIVYDQLKGKKRPIKAYKIAEKETVIHNDFFKT